jgi:transglutaminase-like putative cysteine protease
MEYDIPQPVAMMGLLSVHPSRRGDLETPDDVRVSEGATARQFTDGFGNIATRIMAPAGRLVIESDFVINDRGEPDVALPDAPQTPVDELPDDVLQYLLPSRYCDIEHLLDTAWNEFAHVPEGKRRVEAIISYARNRIAFDYAHARHTRTAHEGYQEQVGVCRDFAHLAVTLLRCMNIPARYVTGWLGDVRISLSPCPMDFSAWGEVWMDGAWRTFDARHESPHGKARHGRVLMAVGRDAADVAITTSFGVANLVGFHVIADELDPPPEFRSSSRSLPPMMTASR